MPGRPADVLDVTDFLLDTMVQIQDYWNDFYVCRVQSWRYMDCLEEQIGLTECEARFTLTNTNSLSQSDIQHQKDIS